MKRLAILISLILIIGVSTGCGKKRVSLNPGVVKDLVVLTLDGDLPGQTGDQKHELDIVMKWMDRDIIANLKRSGFNAVLIKDMKEYTSGMGKLLVVDVDDFNAGNRAARAFVGFGAGAASLDLSYRLLDEQGVVIAEWKDGVGSSKGGTYCAQTLDRNTIEKIVGKLNN